MLRSNDGMASWFQGDKHGEDVTNSETNELSENVSLIRIRVNTSQLELNCDMTYSKIKVSNALISDTS